MTINGLPHFGQRFYQACLGNWTQADALDQPGDLRQANRGNTLATTRSTRPIRLASSLSASMFKSRLDPSVSAAVSRSITAATRGSAAVRAARGWRWRRAGLREPVRQSEKRERVRRAEDAVDRGLQRRPPASTGPRSSDEVCVVVVIDTELAVVPAGTGAPEGTIGLAGTAGGLEGDPSP